jgi:hypothetical protein
VVGGGEARSSCGRRIGFRAQLSIVGEERHGSKLDGVG